MNTRFLGAVCACALVLAVSTPTNAALLSRLGGQAVYDTDLNVTWLTNANLAASNDFGVSVASSGGGPMTWTTAQSWIGAMDAADYLGFNDWRLPTAGPVNGVAMNYSYAYNGTTDYGYNISAPGTLYAGSKSNEMAYLFYNELSNKAYCTTSGFCPQPGYGLVNVGPFSNFRSNGYWSGTEYAPTTSYAWIFGFDSGIQATSIKDTFNYYALVVRTGDVAAVPVPGAVWLFGSGLLGLLRATHTRKAA